MEDGFREDLGNLKESAKYKHILIRVFLGTNHFKSNFLLNDQKTSLKQTLTSCKSTVSALRSVKTRKWVFPNYFLFDSLDGPSLTWKIVENLIFWIDFIIW